MSSGFLTRFNTNQAVQPQKMVRSLNFRISDLGECTICVVKTKALISCVVTTQLICAFVFVYAKSRFSDVTAHMILV